MTQRALARKIGRPETSLSKIELGQQRIDLVELLDVCRALRIELLDLVTMFMQKSGNQQV